MAYKSTKAKSTSSSSDDEDYNHYEDHYADQIGKSVKCKQFINNVAVTKANNKQTNPLAVQKKQVVKTKVNKVVVAEITPVPVATPLPRNIESEIVNDWEDLLN